MVTRQQIEQWAVRIGRLFAPEKVVLFGSYAYGKPDRSSDVDLLVIMNHTATAIQKASEIRLALPDDMPIDVIVRTPHALQARLAMNDYFMRDIIEKGRVLYASGDH